MRPAPRDLAWSEPAISASGSNIDWSPALRLFRFPPLRWRIDVARDRRRYPPNPEAQEDQEKRLSSGRAANRQSDYENDRPDDGEAGTVYPIVSEAIQSRPP